nr:protein SON isoform X2 [Anolis sagrei ordinatus]
MATSIEQIFRSFVVSKFREIQDQQFGGGKLGSQYNGEINSPEHTSPSDDSVGSVGNLQNDPLVQKIEQVLSEVLGAESQYKPDGREDVVRTKSRSAKRGLSEEVQDEIPRKKSKKDKKHKDKKKKKKRKKEKKEKKHKKQSKESKVNQKECRDLQLVLRSKPENIRLTLSGDDDVNTESVSALKHASVSVQKKTAFENKNSAMPNSDSTSSDNSKLETSKEDSQAFSEVELASEGDTTKATGHTMNLCIEDQSLRMAEAEHNALNVIKDGVFYVEQSEISSALEATEKQNVPENSSHSIAVELEVLEPGLESDIVEVKSLSSVTNSLNQRSMEQSVSASLEISALPHLEASGEAKDSVSTLGFLAMVVGKDFEATSDFLNIAKVKAPERSPKHTPLADMKDDFVHDSGRHITMQDLPKALQSGAEDPEAAPESLHVVSETDLKVVEVGEQKCMNATSDNEAEARKLRETQACGFRMELKGSEKYPRQLQVEKDAKDVTGTAELGIMNKTDLVKSATEKEKLNTVPEPFRVVDLMDIAPPQESEEAVKANSSLKTSFEAVVEEKQDSGVAKDSEPMTEVKIHESISQAKPVSVICGLEAATGITDIAKPHNLEVSKCANKITETIMNLKSMKTVSESSVILKNIESPSDSQHVNERNAMSQDAMSDAMSQEKDLPTDLEEGTLEERDVDPTSDSLHMIFANYSEQNLELHTEPKITIKLKSPELVPQSPHIMDTNNLESQNIKKVKESEMMAGLHDLQKKIECLHKNVKIVEAALEHKTVSYWPALQEKASDTTEIMKKDNSGPDNLQISPKYEEVNTGSQKTTGDELRTESESLLLTSKTSKGVIISSKTVQELEAIEVLQRLKESEGSVTSFDVHSPKKTLESLPTNLKAKEVNLDSLYDLEVECTERSSEFQFPAESSNQVQKQKSEERTEMTEFVKPSESLYVSERDPIQFPESEANNKVVHSESVHLEEPSSETIPKSFYVIQVKNSETTSESRIADVKHLNIDSESTLKAGVEMGENLPKLVSETQKKNELLELQHVSVFHEPEPVVRSKASPITNLEAHTEILHLNENEKLGVAPQSKKCEVVKKAGDVPLFTLGTVDKKPVPSFVHEDEDKELKIAKAVETVVTVEKSEGAKESVDITKETLKPISMIQAKDLETCQKETTLEKKKMLSMHTELSPNIDASGAETFRRPESTQIIEDLSMAAGKAEEKGSGKDTGQDVKLLLKYSQPVTDSIIVSQKENLTEFKMDVKITEANSGVLDETEKNTSKTTLQLETTSKPQFMLDPMDLDDNTQPLSKIETKDSGQVNYERMLGKKDSSSPVTTAAQQITPQLKPSESVSVETDSAGILKHTSDFTSSGTVQEAEVLEISDSQMHVKPGNNLEIKSFEATSDADNVAQKTPPVSEQITGKFSELVSQKVYPDKMKDLGTVLEPQYAQQIKYLESSLYRVGATDLEGSHLPEKGVSEANQQLPLASFGSVVSSVIVEAVKEPEKQLQLEPHVEEKCSEISLESIHTSDVKDACVDGEHASLVGNECPKSVAEVAYVTDVKNLNSEMALELKVAETCFESGSVLTSMHTKQSKDFEAANKCESCEEVKVLQVTQTSTDGKDQMALEGMSKSLLTIDSTSVLLLEGKTSEGSLDPIQGVHMKDSVLPSEYVHTNSKDVSEENLSCICRAEMKAVESTAEHVTEASSSKIISEVTIEEKQSETASESLSSVKKKDLSGIPQATVEEQNSKATSAACPVAEEPLELVQEIKLDLRVSEPVLESVNMAEKDLKSREQVIVEAKDSETILKSMHVTNEKDLETVVQDSLKDKDSEAVTETVVILKEREGSILKEKKDEKTSSKSKDKSKSSKKAKKSRSKSPSKSKKHKKKSRSHSTTRQVASRRERSRSKHDSRSRKKRSVSRHKSRSKSVDKKEDKESLRSRRRRSRSKSRSKSVDRRETSVRSRRRRSRSSDHRKSRSRSIDRRSVRRRRLSRSSDKHKSRSRSVERREALLRSRRRRSRSSDQRKSRSRSADKRDTAVRVRRRRSQSFDRGRTRSRSLDRRGSSVRTRRRQSRSSDRHKSRSRSADDKREPSVRTRRRRSRSPDTRKSRSRSVDRRETTVRARRRRSRSFDQQKSRSRSLDKRESSLRRRRRSRSSDNRRTKSRSVDRRETSLRTRRRRSRSSDNRRSKSKSVDKRETSVRTRRRRSRSSDNRRSKSKSVDKRETSRRRRRRRSSSDRKSRSKSAEKREASVQAKRKRSRSSDTHKSRSKSVDNVETSARSKRRRSRSADHKSRTKSVEKEEASLRSRHRKSKSSDRRVSKSKSRSKSTERRKDKESSDASTEKVSRQRSKSKSVEKTEEAESLDKSTTSRAKSPEQRKSRSRSKSVDKSGERENLRRSRSKDSKSPENRSRRRRTVSRSKRNRSRSLTRRRLSRSKSGHRSRTQSRSRSPSRSRRWRRTRSRSLSRQRSLSRERRRRARRNRSRSPDRRRKRSDSRDSYRISLRLRSRSRSPVRLGRSRSAVRRRSTSKSPDTRRSRSSSRSPKRLTDLDKAQLLEIAKANAAAMCAKAGVPLPPSLMPVVTPEKKEETSKVTSKTAKETILELTEKCKKIAQSQEDDVIVNKPHVSDEEEEEHPFINHPFKLNEPKPIFFNLTTPTVKPPPPKNQVTLTKEFPVSSGSQHRKKEADSAYGEWVPVDKDKEEKKDDVFPNPANLEPVDISSALSERSIAQKRLTENTFDLEAMCLLNRAQERIDAWAELNSIPGHFTGSTGAQVLSSEQLSNSGPQAWVKKGQICLVAVFLPRSMPALLFATLRPPRPRINFLELHQYLEEWEPSS